MKLSDLGQAQESVIITAEETIDRQRCRQKGRYRRPRGSDSCRDREHRQRLRPRKAAGTSGQACRRRSSDPVRCGHRNRNERAEGLLEDAKAQPRRRWHEGIVPGGGVTLIRCGKATRQPERPEGRRSAWARNIMANVLDRPLRSHRRRTPALDGAVVVNRVRQLKGKTEGYDADKDKYATWLRPA